MFFWPFSKAISTLIQIWLKMIWRCQILQELAITLQHYGVQKDVTLDDYLTKNYMLFGIQLSCWKIHIWERLYGAIEVPLKIRIRITVAANMHSIEASNQKDNVADNV